ncbi:WD-40 repeat-containing protein [Reticulomyxa filosa]|uniref:WD-40 repeat-containing protein n=1 Tax=Reticulomyxa filosa TaxID=46433 RepID=X6P990_RETFI|nr:WD-40 repeat-containing protein [Reticulomyxa filosa]|eukprot:ETO34634.1 WD-40 repeat-containing protein [Reticulomyxa filosa]
MNRPEEEVQIIVQYWIRVSNITLGWIHDFDKIVANYATANCMIDTFCSSSKLLKTFFQHTNCVKSIDYSTFNDNQLICSGSYDNTVRVLDIANNKQIRLFNEHSSLVFCVKFSQYHRHNYHSNVVCSAYYDTTIRCWDIKKSKQLQTFNGHANGVCDIKFSSFNCGQYLCSGSYDNTVRLWDVETSKSLHAFNGHEDVIWCVDISPLQSNNSKNNNIGVIGGNGYTICSGSADKTICIWDIETTKQSIVFKGHEDWVMSVKYGSNELGAIDNSNVILSGSADKSVRLWDIRSGQQIQEFNGHTSYVNDVEYSPFVVDNIEIGGTSNVVCSGSADNTIRFCDIRANKKELHVIKGHEKDGGILCLKFLQLDKNMKNNNRRDCHINLCYGSYKGPIHIWG